MKFSRPKIQLASFFSIMLWTELINFFIPISTAIVSPTCDYIQEMSIGQDYYIYSPDYSNSYPAGSNCRWVARSPPNTKINLVCSEINLPSSTDCVIDKLSISLSGDVNFNDAHHYCGKGTLDQVSYSNAVSVGLVASSYYGGGRFACKVRAIGLDGPSTPPPITTTASPTNCDCGWRQQRRIVGGVETGVNEYPFMAALINLNIRQLWCGAVIISNKHGLTAAHCLDSGATNFAMLVGDHDLTNASESPDVALYVLDFYRIHSYYNSKTKENDIAIITTQNQINFNDNVGPICLPFRYTDTDTEGYLTTVLGWGTEEFTGPTSDVLKAANLTIVNNQDCQRAHPSEVITPTHICTYGYRKDACQYDSGGPVIWWDWTTRRFSVLGIISYGFGCGSDRPGINARVTSYMSWIIRQTIDVNYCIK